jgi:hypothetical protein
MSASNGRVYETQDGTVQATNPRGLRLAGESEWRNYSKWADPIDPPSRGQRVRLALDTSGFIRSLEVLDESHDDGIAARTSSAPPAPSAPSGSTRLGVLLAAATFAAGKALGGTEPTSADVLKIAEAWEHWVLAGNEST